MELLWTALLLGLVGSLHCAVMCGPLMLAVCKARGETSMFHKTSVVYHAGRITTYCVLGLVFGAIGSTFAMAGLQQSLSILAGLAILAGVFLYSKPALLKPFLSLTNSLKKQFGSLLKHHSLTSQFLLGSINGLLPCGLVYVAAAGAASTMNPALGALHMAAFGLGTLPMLLGVGALGAKVSFLNKHAQRLIPISVTVVALLLVVRGLGLGIPYFSPNFEAEGAKCAACHKTSPN